MKNAMILGQQAFYSMDCHSTGLNNNVLVVGASGSGKTRSIVSPNIIMAEGSYVISDPKGNLYDKYGEYLAQNGYTVRLLDFTDPTRSSHYNFFNYIKNNQDILKVAHMLVNLTKSDGRTIDPFWDDATQLLLQALIAYLWEEPDRKEQKLENILKLSRMCNIIEEDQNLSTCLDLLMEAKKRVDPDSYSCKYYDMFRVAADKTLKSILITLNSKLGLFDTPEINELTKDDDIDITSIGKKKTALFVVVSDTDRSLDGLVNLFFTQTMNELCSFADKECPENRLPVPVRFIMDDFATNCKIDEFPRMISSIRSRGISVMIMIQAESQLRESYGEDGKTIIANCDTYVYLGGNDVETARLIAQRCDVPLMKILTMPVGTNWIFRRGDVPRNGNNYNLDLLEPTLSFDKGTLDGHDSH